MSSHPCFLWKGSMKKSFFGSSVKFDKFYFIIDEKSQVIIQRESDKNQTVTESISFAEIKSVNAFFSDSSYDSKAPHAYKLSVVCNDQTKIWNLCAENESIQKRWLEILGRINQAPDRSNTIRGSITQVGDHHANSNEKEDSVPRRSSAATRRRSSITFNFDEMEKHNKEPAVVGANPMKNSGGNHAEERYVRSNKVTIDYSFHIERVTSRPEVIKRMTVANHMGQNLLNPKNNRFRNRNTERKDDIDRRHSDENESKIKRSSLARIISNINLDVSAAADITALSINSGYIIKHK
jgi:hypothetical protein